MPLLKSSHVHREPVKPKQVQLLTQDISDSPSVKHNECAGSLASSDSCIQSLAMNFASNARLNSPLNAVTSKLDFDSPEWGRVGTPKKGLKLSEAEVGGCKIENNENIHTLAKNEIAQDRLCLSESKKLKRSKMATLNSRSRSCLSEMTNIVANRLQTCLLEVETDFYQNSFNSEHSHMSPSPIGPKASISYTGGNSLGTVSGESPCKSSKRVLSFHSVSSNAPKPVSRKFSCPLEPTRNRRQPEEADIDSDFMELLNNSFNLLSPLGIPSPNSEKPTSCSSAAISALLTAPILSVPFQKSTPHTEEICDHLLSPPIPKPRCSRISESSYECESRKRVSPHTNWTELPDAKRKRLALSPQKSTTETIPKLTPLKIGDETRYHILPLVRGKQPNLASISGETLVRVLRGEFDHFLQSRLIVDCRYPYEFEGGHIKEAVNLWTKEMCHERFFHAHSFHSQSESKRQIIIFHCEFSSHRAPKMYEFVRETDRRVNGERYPQLNYPEIYLLHAGYREFFKSYSDFCFPRNYIEMSDEKYKEDMKKCRIKSKTCDNEMRARGNKSSGLRLMNRRNTSLL